MYDNNISELYSKIIGFIEVRRLKDALSALSGFISENINWELRSQLDQIQTSYNYMLDYRKKDMIDPERPDLYRKLLTDTLYVADQAFIENKSQSSYNQYFSLRKDNASSRTLKQLLSELESYSDNMAVAGLLDNTDGSDQLVIRNRYESAYKELFESTWTNSNWSKQQENEAGEYLHSELLPNETLCLFVSSVTLSLMESFDLKKFMFLFDAYEHSTVEVSQRALIGIAIITHLYHTRLDLYQPIFARINHLNEDPRFADALHRIEIQFLRSQETEKIDKKMREEIIPEMLKSVTNLRNTQFGFNEADEEKDDFNPDWQDAIEQSGLGDKIREMNELQMEGADIYMSTFSHLKSFPFFREISNWFYPFDNNHTSVVQEMKEINDKSVMDLILHSSFFCDSDKYSMSLLFAHIPKFQRDSMISQLVSEHEMKDIQNEQQIKSLEEHARLPETVSNQYIQNLYRFFKLYARRHEFRDIFKESIELHRYSLFSTVLNNPDYLKNIATYYFKKGYFRKAATTFEEFIIHSAADPEILQKLGYCYQKEKIYSGAITYYLKADVLRPDSVWTNRHLATCYRMTENFPEAIKYYKKVEDIQPNNKTITFYMGSCYAGMEMYDEALNYFFKIDLSDPHNIKNQRAIAWCSFLSGKYEQSLKYYQKIVEVQSTSLDYLNMGHVLYVCKETAKAVETYGKSLNLSKSKDEFLSYFNKDRIILIAHGVPEDDIPLILDVI